MPERVRLGKTDIQVTPIGLGCWQFSRTTSLPGGYWGSLETQPIRQIVSLSLRHGLNWFDTAEAYGWGNSEQALSEALQASGVDPGEVVIATKWFPLLRTAGSITRTIDERLARLSPYPIDLHQVHFPGSLSSIRKQMGAMAELKQQGQIRSIGVSNFSARRMRRAHRALSQLGLVLAGNQVRYSLLDRRIERSGVLATARELGITIIAYSPLAQGILSGKYHDAPDLIKKRAGPRRFMPAFGRRRLRRTAPLIEELRKIGSAHGATASQVALAWLIRFHGDAVVAIPGAYTPEQAAENAAAVELNLSRQEMRRLDEISAAA